MHPIQYDLVVIGSGPAGQKGAIAAAKLGKRVAMVILNRMHQATSAGFTQSFRMQQ
jgi:pyruvate/2-oxoglutarate dehydrogenase complex dihydrolipoamide dehydrogenase (E3) component